MKALVTDIRNHLRQPWLLSILFIAIIPIFPEYISIPLAGASLWAAARDAKQPAQHSGSRHAGQAAAGVYALHGAGGFLLRQPL